MSSSDSRHITGEQGELMSVGDMKSVARHAHGSTYACSFAQRRLWMFEQLHPGTTVYNLSGAIGLKGRLDIQVLRNSVQKIVHRHSVLRSRFCEAGGLVVQVIMDEIDLPLEVLDLSHLMADEKAVRMRDLKDKEI